ncbi:hypothetical protein [Anabaena sp. UHCC 0253]|uniref:hypothetical protein n=1 Tax=Anabaena sp. UHCC 0253 TaxID=2590019 RepID=UPI0020C51383|nr:hypothetical protein [Anabaena sp. UHCC 0253]
MPKGNLSEKVNEKVNYQPLMASFIVMLVGHSTIDQNFNNPPEQVLIVSNSTTILDEKKALDLVWSLPKVQRKAREIQRLSRGSIRVSSRIDSYPTADEPYYVVSVIENHSDQTTSPIYWFRVSNPSGVVEALDLVQNQYISLDKWNPDGR